MTIRPATQQAAVAQGIHGLPKASMHPRRQLGIGRQTFHRFLFPHGVVAFDPLQDAGIENEEAAVDEPAFGGRLLLE